MEEGEIGTRFKTVMVIRKAQYSQIGYTTAAARMISRIVIRIIMLDGGIVTTTLYALKMSIYDRHRDLTDPLLSGPWKDQLTEQDLDLHLHLLRRIYLQAS